jgi:hypothetical protein
MAFERIAENFQRALTDRRTQLAVVLEHARRA